MCDKKLNKRKSCIAIILIVLFVGILMLLTPMILSIILQFALPSIDGYLLTGFSFFVFWSILIIIIPITLFAFLCKKNPIKADRKKLLKQTKVFSLSFILLFVMFGCVFVNRGYIYIKDIIEGPQEAIMTNAVIKRKSGYRSGSYLYIIGYIDNEEIKLKLIRDAKSNVVRNKSYKMLRIKYYKNIEEVYDIEYIY